METQTARYVANNSNALQLRLTKLIDEGQAFLRASGTSRLRTSKFCFCARRGNFSFCYRKRWRWHTLLERDGNSKITYADPAFAPLWIQCEAAIREQVELADIEVEVLGEML